MTNGDRTDLKLQLEADARIVAYYRKPNFGILGSCKPQPRELVDRLCERFAGTNYSDSSWQAISGQRTVDVVCASLNSLPNLKAWQTPHNHAADVYWEWDVILERENHLYPIQVKSGIDDIWECQKNLAQRKEGFSQKIENDIQKISDDYNYKIRSLMERHGWKSRENKAVFELEKVRDRKIAHLMENLTSYEMRDPLFIWTSEDDETIVELVHLFASLFSIQGDVVTFSNQAVEAYEATRPKSPEQLRLETDFQKMIDEREKLSQICDLLEQTIAMRLETLQESRKLEDILCIQISKNALALIRPQLAKVDCSIKIIQEGLDAKVEPKTILISLRLGKRIELISDYSKEKYEPFYNKLKKLIASDKQFHGEFAESSLRICQLYREYVEFKAKLSLLD